jgi:hypothetical protein
MVTLFLASCAASPGVPATEPPAFTITTGGEGNDVALSSGGNTLVLDVRSPQGIGRADFEHVSGPFPEKFLLRLHLSGLEELRLIAGETTVIASVPAGEIHAVSQRVVSSEQVEQIILEDSPNWMEIQFVVEGTSTSGSSAQAGFFEIELPMDLMREADRFSIQWIDFFR